MGLAITPPLTRMGRLFWRVLTKTGQAVRWVLTKTGQALRWVVTKVGQAVSRVKPSDPSQDTDAITGGDVSGKSQSQESPVSFYTRDYFIDIPVDNDDEHRVVALREPLLSEDQANAAYVVRDFPTPLVAVPEVPTKHQLEAALGSPVGKDGAKVTDVVTESSMLPMAVPEEPPNSSYRWVVKQVSPVMDCSLSTLSEPKPPRFGKLGRYDGGQRILLAAVPEVPTKHQLEAALGSPVGKDEAKVTDVVTESSMLPMAVPEEPPNTSYRWVAKQVSPVMDCSLSTLSEPKPPRFGKLGRYDGGQRILLVGEGDFSFSACLAAAFGDASNMVATSLDTFDFLRKNYKRAPENIKELKRRGCEVIHRVDATKMASHPKLCSIQFDRIIYNFPYRDFSKLNEPRGVQISYHQSLVSGFMANAKQMIDRDNGEIHITHKCVGFLKDWNIVQLGYMEGLDLARAVQFKLQNYPGYCTKYGFGGDRNFDCHPSETTTLVMWSGAAIFVVFGI